MASQAKQVEDLTAEVEAIAALLREYTASSEEGLSVLGRATQITAITRRVDQIYAAMHALRDEVVMDADTDPAITPKVLLEAVGLSRQTLMNIRDREQGKSVTGRRSKMKAPAE